MIRSQPRNTRRIAIDIPRRGSSARIWRPNRTAWRSLTRVSAWRSPRLAESNIRLPWSSNRMTFWYLWLWFQSSSKINCNKFKCKCPRSLIETHNSPNPKLPIHTWKKLSKRLQTSRLCHPRSLSSWIAVSRIAKRTSQHSWCRSWTR